jgi:hypothetical protein
LRKEHFFYPLCSGEHRKSQILFIFDGIFVNAAVVLTMGVFLSGYIIYLKGSDFLVGLLNNSSAWASIVAVASFFIYKRMKKRKKFLIVMNILSRVLVCSIIFLPLFSSDQALVIDTVVVMVILGNVFWGIYSIGSTVWLISVLSPQLRNEYINVRMLCLRISFTFFTFIMGFVLEWFHKSYTGFLIIFSTSLLLSFADIIVLSKIKEPRVVQDENDNKSRTGFFTPLKDRPYREFLLFIFFFYFCITISSSFTPLYLIRYLKMDYRFISSINLIAYVTMIVCTMFWGRIERKNGQKFVFKVTSFFVICEYLIYSFLNEKTHFLLFFSAIIGGIGNSGFNISVFAYRYEIIPENSRTIYEGWFGAAYGLSLFASPFIGNIFLRKLPVLKNAVYTHSDFQLMYIISFLLALVVIFLMFFLPHNKRSNSLKQENGSL